MFRKGRRLFSGASIGVAIIGLLHSIGHFAGPKESALQAVEAAMASYHMDMGLGFLPSLYEIFVSLSLTFSILFWGIAAFNLVVASSDDVTPALLRKIAIVNAVVMGMLTGLYFYHRILPPFVTIAVVFVLFAIVAMRTPRSE